jgi:hypothetical protein
LIRRAPTGDQSKPGVNVNAYYAGGAGPGGAVPVLPTLPGGGGMKSGM